MIVPGRITDANPRTLTIEVAYDPRFVTQQWDEVQVDIPDGRRISPEQRRKAYALMGEIANWAGMTPRGGQADPEARLCGAPPGRAAQAALLPGGLRYDHGKALHHLPD